MVRCERSQKDTCKNCCSKMRILLAVLILFSLSVALSTAACYRDKLHLDIKTRSSGCMHEGKFHKINSEWTFKCEDCTCSDSGLYCCDRTLQPSGYDTEACNAVLNEESCTFKVIRKDDPSIPCKVKAMKG